MGDSAIDEFQKPDRSKTDTGLTESSHSSCSSAERYSLDEFNTKPILLYQWRGKLATSSQKDLCAWLDKDEHHRVTRKPLPKYTSYLDIKRHDLYLPEEKKKFANMPNYDSSLASIRIPMGAYLSRILTGGYEDLYIVSEESSPTSSIASQESLP